MFKYLFLIFMQLLLYFTNEYINSRYMNSRWANAFFSSLIFSSFDVRISGRLEKNSLSNTTTTHNVPEKFMVGARLHLIVQIPVMNILNKPENSEVVLRQKEYIYCLRRNLINPHVSFLRSSNILQQNSLRYRRNLVSSGNAGYTAGYKI